MALYWPSVANALIAILFGSLLTLDVLARIQIIVCWCESGLLYYSHWFSSQLICISPHIIEISLLD